MKQIPRNLAVLWLFACLSLTGLTAQAQLRPPLAAAKYFPVDPPQPPLSTSGKIEVIEFFSYGCGHCAVFQPEVDAWLQRVDTSKVELTYIPVTFRPDFALLARGYYAAEALGVAKSTHHGIFAAIFSNTAQPVRTFNDVAALYEKVGVKAADLTAAAQKFDVETKLRRSNELLQTFRVDGTPTIVVAGKYRVTGESAGGNDKVFGVVDELIAKELAAKKSAAK